MCACDWLRCIGGSTWGSEGQCPLFKMSPVPPTQHRCTQIASCHGSTCGTKISSTASLKRTNNAQNHCTNYYCYCGQYHVWNNSLVLGQSNSYRLRLNSNDVFECLDILVQKELQCKVITGRNTKHSTSQFQ